MAEKNGAPDKVKAWAIDTNTRGFAYLGIYAFDPHTKTLPWQDGCRIALFRTREEARAALTKTRKPYYFPKATVRRVVITVEVQH